MYVIPGVMLADRLEARGLPRTAAWLRERV